MPAQNGHQQQRRVFRGRGGATDRNIPPKKHHGRTKVKYQQEESSVNQHNPNDNIEVDDADHLDIEENIQNLSLDSDDQPSSPPPPSRFKPNRLQDT